MRTKRDLSYNGVTYASSLEVNVARDLDERGVKYEYESVRLDYTVSIPHAYCADCGGRLAHVDRKYTPDFVLLASGVIVETKGRFTAADRKKHASIKKASPDLDLRMLFSHNNLLTKGGKKRYSDWCSSKGIGYAIGMTIPEEWTYGGRTQ